MPNEPDGDDSDYTTGPMDEYGNLYDLSAHVNDIVNITANTTWNQKRYIYNNIVIPSGVTLTINSDVIFYQDSKITLQGGTLHVAGGHLYNADINITDFSNSIVKISNGGIIDKVSDKAFSVPLGTELEMNYGTIK